MIWHLIFKICCLFCVRCMRQWSLFHSVRLDSVDHLGSPVIVFTRNHSGKGEKTTSPPHSICCIVSPHIYPLHSLSPHTHTHIHSSRLIPGLCFKIFAFKTILAGRKGLVISRVLPSVNAVIEETKKLQRNL